MTCLFEITGIILAGGESRRMGKSKAFLEIGGRPLVAGVVSKMVKVCREVLIVTKNPLDFLEFDLKIVRDLVPGQGPLGGLATGLFYAHYDWALAVACDLPFLQAALLEHLARRALSSPGGARALVPRTKDGWQPLAAAYSKACFKPAQDMLNKGGHKLDDLMNHGVIWKPVEEEELRAVDQDLVSFFNINTPEDLDRARSGIESASDLETDIS